MKTFTNYAAKAKQFLNLLQGYTKGIRLTAILILLLMGVNNAWGNVVSSPRIYYDNTNTSYEKVAFMVGHNSYSRAYKLTKIENTNLWYRYLSDTGNDYWGDATQIAIFGVDWDNAENSNISHRAGYTNNNYTTTRTLSNTSGSCNSLDYGNTYQKIFDNIFPEVRTTTLRVTLDVVDQDKDVVVEEEVVEEEVDKISFPPVIRKKVRTPRVREASSGQMAFNLKLNAAGWLLGVPNVAMECSVAPNLSINLPIYYSGVNMNLYTFDFKGLILQPELRFYVPNTYGFYVGAHAGIAWYNCHRGGDYRYQNSGWNRPTYGGGLNIGYQLPLKKGSGWKVEFGFGAGIYDAKYDIFYNEENGPYVARNQYTLYYGFDQGHISFLYSFDFRRKEGRR